ncbi:MAG: crossover junction endodeoxyribonuclease RuvC [Patescibacteria group bacterium]
MTTKNTSKQNTILGIDPGFGRLGYAVLTGTRNNPQITICDCLETSAKIDHGERLVKIAEKIKQLLNAHNPNLVAIEKLYFSRNVKTALQVAEARGVILQTITSLGYPILEFSPQEIKISVTGVGNADKLMVQKMLKIMFKLNKMPKFDDATDALAIALTGLLHKKLL